MSEQRVSDEQIEDRIKFWGNPSPYSPPGFEMLDAYLDLRDARARIANLEKDLREYLIANEFQVDHQREGKRYCFWCDGSEDTGHAPKCPIAERDAKLQTIKELAGPAILETGVLSSLAVKHLNDALSTLIQDSEWEEIGERTQTIRELELKLAETRALIRLQETEPPFDVTDDQTTDFAVEIARLKNELAVAQAVSAAMVELLQQLADRNNWLEEAYEGEHYTKGCVSDLADEALNSPKVAALRAQIEAREFKARQWDDFLKTHNLPDDITLAELASKAARVEELEGKYELEVRECLTRADNITALQAENERLREAIKIGIDLAPGPDSAVKVVFMDGKVVFVQEEALAKPEAQEAGEC